MAEISLSVYQDKLEGLLQDSRFDEVIAHVRHILKSQPKNLRAYQQLGAALFANERWEEATGVLRRMLGAQPSDFQTHTQLAGAYQKLEDFDRAIWHAERALDQQPNNPAAISLIRDLYRVHRRQEIDRLQLTSAALAQQHIRGNLLSEALDTLATALERDPERLDLQLLRARTLWLDGQRMEAAESAVSILEKLPYAIDANRILTELWLAEQRPSDAQVYLERIEDLDPYLAHQLAAGEPAPEDLRLLEELDYQSISQREQSIVNPDWLNTLSDTDAQEAATDEENAGGGLGALFGIDDEDSAEEQARATDDLDDLLSDDEIEALFSELVSGEPVAEVSEAKPAEDGLEQLFDSMDEQGMFENADATPADAETPADLGIVSAQSTADDAETVEDSDSLSGELDDDLASLLEQLDEADEDGDWMTEIQTGNDGDDQLDYLDDFDREWVKEREQDGESAGAPWLSAAMRERMDQDEAGDYDLFSDDEQLQNLLNNTNDTEPILLDDIEDWLNPEQKKSASAADEAGERFLDLEDGELLTSPPARSWLDEEQETTDDSSLLTASDEDPNQLNANLIDNWQSELGDDDDDDPYVDWLSDDAGELDDDDLSMLAVDDGDDPQAASGSFKADTARAWGLDDPEQLSDFVEEEVSMGDGEAAPNWLNAMAPGLDRENDASTDDPDEFARPMSAPGEEFAWVSDIVDEETGEMTAVDAAELESTLYFRFSNPPAWLNDLQAGASNGAPGQVIAGVSALSLDENIDALELDDLTFDDYFNFDTPTDKLDIINLDEDTEKLNFVGLDWDDYFDLESPTEKTIAITIDENPGEVDFEAIGLDDYDFNFETPTEKMPAVTLDAGDPLDFDDIGLGDNPKTDDAPTWLDYDAGDDDADSGDDDRNGGQSTL